MRRSLWVKQTKTSYSQTDESKAKKGTIQLLMGRTKKGWRLLRQPF